MLMAAADYGVARTPRPGWGDGRFGAAATTRSWTGSRVSETAGVGFSAQFPRRTNLLVNQTIAYSPSYLYGLFPSVGQPGPGDAPIAAPDYSAYDSESLSYATTVLWHTV